MTTPVVLLSGVTANGAGAAKNLNTKDMSFHGSVTGTGAVTATIKVECSNDNANWMTLGTITLVGASPQHDGFISAAQWMFVRGNVSGLTGTGAAASLTAGVP